MAILSGCLSPATRPKVISSEDAAAIEINKSTKEDVISAVGLPHKREVVDDGQGQTSEWWVYLKGRGWTRTNYYVPVAAIPVAQTGAYTVNLIPMVQLGLTGKESDVALALEFDDSGVVTKAIQGGRTKQ